MAERDAEEGDGEEELAGRQAPALYPIGRALRATYGADNHDSLGNDLTTLMLNLARVEPPAEPPSVEPPSAAATAIPPATIARSRLVRMVWRLLGR